MERVLQDEYRAQLCAEAKLRCVICGEKGHKAFSSKKLWAYRWCYGGKEEYLHVACEEDRRAELGASLPARRRRSGGERADHEGRAAGALAWG
ncbi:unnamed protein product [Urochloa humidicola]